MEVKYESKRYATHIKRLAPSKAAPVISDSDESVKVTHNKKSSTGVLLDHKQEVNNTPKIFKTRVTVYCARRQECMSVSGNLISPTIVLVKIPNMHPSRTGWERPWVTGSMLSIIIIKRKISGKCSLYLLRNITR